MMERKLIEEVPENGADKRCDGDTCECAKERGRKEVEHHSADEGYPREDEVQALLPIGLKEVDVEDLDLAAESYHAEENCHQGEARRVMGEIEIYPRGKREIHDKCPGPEDGNSWPEHLIGPGPQF